MPNDKELRELNEWIHIRVFGWLHSREKEYPNRKGWSRNGEFCLDGDMLDYVNDPAACIELQKKCAVKCNDMGLSIGINFTPARQSCCDNEKPFWDVMTVDCENEISVSESAETLELAWAKFSKALFSTTND